MGNEKYADYVPDRVSPHSLSREFLLSVNLLLYNSLANSVFRSYIISKPSKYWKIAIITIKCE